MDTFNLLFGLHLSMKIIKITDNLSRTLQTRSISASEGQSVAELSVKTLQLMRNDESFDAFFRLVNCFREQRVQVLPNYCVREKFLVALKLEREKNHTMIIVLRIIIEDCILRYWI